jgi:flagellar hook-length control protein FliK
VAGDGAKTAPPNRPERGVGRALAADTTGLVKTAASAPVPPAPSVATDAAVSISRGVASGAVTPIGAPVAAVLAPTVAAPSPASPVVSPLPDRPAAQLAGPIAVLRTAGPGQYAMVVRVCPESIGPVRVLAHIGADGVRIELIGATDQARDALRVALPDLRRDLAGAGLPADLSLGSEPGSGGRHRPGVLRDPPTAAARGGPAPDPAPAPETATRGLDITL